MNLFTKYGIKQVADVTFYSIEQIGDEEIYTPVLYLDSLKLSTLEKTNERVTAKGGKGNKKLISWDFGKEIKLNNIVIFPRSALSLVFDRYSYCHTKCVLIHYCTRRQVCLPH